MTTQRSMDSRLRKLEGGATSEIVIWCDDADEVPATIGEMIAHGELRETDRPRCIHWAVARLGGSHERALAELI